MSLLNPFRLLKLEIASIRTEYKKLIDEFKEIQKENLILLEEVRVLKKLLYGIEWDKADKDSK